MGSASLEALQCCRASSLLARSGVGPCLLQHGEKTTHGTKMRLDALTSVDDIIDLEDGNLNFYSLQPSIIVVVYLIKDLVDEPVKEPVEEPAE